jgi:hypothetical protein
MLKKIMSEIIYMRTEQEMMDLILSVAKADERIRAVSMEGSRANLRIPVHPDRYSGNDTDSVPEVSGHESEGMRTAFRRYPDTCRQPILY